MDDEFFEEDFSETPLLFTEEEPKPRQIKKIENNSFEILTIEKIVENVLDMVMKVQQFFTMPSSGVRALLSHYKWNYERLIGEYFEAADACGGLDDFFKRAKVMNPFTSLPPVNSIDNDSNDCKICCDTCDDMHGLECGHKFCRGCWNHYLTQKIAEEGLSQSIMCLEPNCEMLVDDENVLMWIDDSTVLAKYNRSMAEDFVMHNRAIQWCPSADCLHAARKKVSTATNMPWSCKCEYDFCFDCVEYWHEPVSCARLNQWKNADDTESRKWIVEHAKPCPKCKTSIEKNGGCNHMTCRMCRQEFCWVCVGLWSRDHACNRFDETKPFVDIDLARFQHFQERYVNQLESLKTEANIYRNGEKRVDDLKDMCSWTNNQVRFMREAIKVLHVSRRTLTYTFVFAYFLNKNNQVEIFEENQSDLERAVERLSGYLEQEITPENAVELKTKIQDSFNYCQTRCKALMDHIHEAREQNLWEMK